VTPGGRSRPSSGHCPRSGRAGEHQQGRLEDRRHPFHNPVDKRAGGEQAGRRGAEAERVVGDERLAGGLSVKSAGSLKGIGKVFRLFKKYASAIWNRSDRETPTRG